MSADDFDTGSRRPSGPTTLEFSYLHPLSAARVAAVVYGLMALIFVPFMVLTALAQGGAEGAGAIGVALFMLIVYPVMGFLGTAIAACFFNVAAKWVGGVRIDVG